MNDAEGPGEDEAKAVWIAAKQHLGQQIEEGVEEKHDYGEEDDEPNEMVIEGLMQDGDQQTENDEIGDGVAYEDGPQKVLRILQVFMEDFGGAPSGAHLLANAEAAQRENTGLHA